MLKMTAREVQVRHGDFVKSVQKDVVCVTRHGRPLYWAVSDRQVRGHDPSVLIGRLLLLNGQLRQAEQGAPTESLSQALEREVDPVITTGLTPNAVEQIVHESRK